MPTTPVFTDHDYQGVNRPVNLPTATAAGQPVTFEQWMADKEGLAWKDSVRVGAFTNVTLTAPGAAINGVTMAAGDRVLLTAQTAPAQNGIYIWSGAAVALVRAPDADTAVYLEGAIVTIEEGTLNAGSTYRQSSVNFTLDTGAVNWSSFGTAAPAASETVPGVVESATQAETDSGLDDTRFITPLKFKNSTLNATTKKFTFGDGTATSFTLTHNLNSFDVDIEIVEAGGSRRSVSAEVRRTSVNVVTILATPAPALNSLVAYVTRFAII